MSLPRRKWSLIPTRPLISIGTGVLIGALGTFVIISNLETHLSFGFSSPAKANIIAKDEYSLLNLFGDVWERVLADYVDPIDSDKLIESAINSMIAGLDRSSSYFNSKTYTDMQVQNRAPRNAQWGGIGVEIMLDNNTIKVVGTFDDTPAAKAGLKPGDIITHVDKAPLKGLTVNEAAEKMQGRLDTTGVYTILRKDSRSPIDVPIIRKIINIAPVKFQVFDDVVYIRIASFGQYTMEWLKKAFTDLQPQISERRLKGYIIDMRNNSGGLLDMTIAVADAFLEKGEILSTRGREPGKAQRFNAKPGDLAKGKPIFILLNKYSVGSPEFVAGALQDHKRAIVIGERSAGHGSVQTIIPLGTGNGALKLTTARHYTPSGRSIDGKGIQPDIEMVAHTESMAQSIPNVRDDPIVQYSIELLRGLQVHSAFSPPKEDTR